MFKDIKNKAKLADYYISLPIKCKTEETFEIEDLGYVEKGLLSEQQVEEQLKDTYIFRYGTFNTQFFVSYYEHGKEIDKTFLETTIGHFIVGLTVKELDKLVYKSQPKTIYNLWGIL